MSSKSDPLRQATLELVISCDFFSQPWLLTVCLYSTCCGIVNVIWKKQKEPGSSWLPRFLFAPSVLPGMDEHIHQILARWCWLRARKKKVAISLGPFPLLGRHRGNACAGAGGWPHSAEKLGTCCILLPSFALLCKKITQLFPFDHNILFWKSFIIVQTCLLIFEIGIWEEAGVFTSWLLKVYVAVGMMRVSISMVRMMGISCK